MNMKFKETRSNEGDVQLGVAILYLNFRLSLIVWVVEKAYGYLKQLKVRKGTDGLINGY